MTSSKKLYIALDVGTSRSGYAYSFTSNPDDVTFSSFSGATKTPTSILLDKDGKFSGFGVEAEKRYMDSCDRGFQATCTLFTDIKSALSNPTLNKKTPVHDITGCRKRSAFDLWTMAVKYLKNHVFKAVNSRMITLAEDDASFVMLVPGIASDRAKWFIRQVALNAGIDANVLTLAYKSEASSLWCQRLNGDGDVTKPGTRYMTCNIGGGLADVIAHETMNKAIVGSLSIPCGGKWGGETVDGCFRSFLVMLFGSSAIETFTKEYPGLWLRLLNDYEMEKMLITDKKEVQISVEVPKALITKALEFKGLSSASDLEALINSPNFGGHFKLTGSKLVVDSEATEGMFQFTANSICTLLEDLQTKNPGLHRIFITGGLAESPILRRHITQKFTKVSIIFPEGGKHFSLKGAVVFAHKPAVIQTRIMPLTYGLQNTVPYDETRHRGGKTDTINGEKMCTNNFHPLIKAGETVKYKQQIAEEDKPLRAEDKEQSLTIVSCGSKGLARPYGRYYRTIDAVIEASKRKKKGLMCTANFTVVLAG
ncbi:HS12B-like protein [Mya arenaria]|uniref:HS12B-like protein n=1 Tax=Mya arenaria TaxID=6604 RepID=A0ABY7DSY9_MYAAR|nr:HS12B-like protein [Mya arenaria]